MNHIERLIQIVENYYKLQPGQLLDKTRVEYILLPRFMALYILRTFNKDSYPRLAKEFVCDHATVMNAVKRFQDLLDTDQGTYKKDYAIILNIYQSDKVNQNKIGANPENEIIMYQTLAAL